MVEPEEYIKYIKSQGCLICGSTPVDPHHLEARGMGKYKAGIKDFSCIPLCREHHSEWHFNSAKFEEKYHFKSWREAFRLLRRFII